VLDDFQHAAPGYGPWERLAGRADVMVFTDHVADPDALVARLAPFDALVAMRERTRFPRALLERLPRLRLLVSTGMGTAHIDVAAARERGIVVCGTRGSGQGPAELTWALILALARQVPAEDARIRAGGWGGPVGVDIQGATLGVLGLGRVGSKVAAIGRVFGMDVISWSPTLERARAEAAGAEAVSRADLFARADVLTIHVRLGERTQGLVGDADLRRMRPTAFLVNTARGPIVDEAALVAALQEGRLAGAGLDVFGREPLPADDPLRSAPRTILTPHVGYVTERSYHAFYGEAVEDVERYLAGDPVRRLDQGDPA
jgi:phosphoglycerate dehydrogenase-like enzyme